MGMCLGSSPPGLKAEVGWGGGKGAEVTGQFSLFRLALTDELKGVGTVSRACPSRWAWPGEGIPQPLGEGGVLQAISKAVSVFPG